MIFYEEEGLPKMNKNNSIKRPLKDERDEQIDTRSKSHALEFMIAATQVLTAMCLIKGNPAWKGSLALLFLGGAADLFYKYDQYSEKPYIQIGIVIGLIGIALLVWFGFSG
ncbi:DUF6442 family protein [Faecalispora sporosphaeroides]|nr:DUF6442 family protein [Faecalispora sporosphaeroides]